jgi:YegS/Rv2252/BmrU family lipid kinase
VGGDGTVNEILNGIVGSDAKLGIIPAGTANDVARHHGIPADTEQACEIITAGKTHEADVIIVNDWHYLTVGGIGLPCETLLAAERLKTGNSASRFLARAFAGKLYLLTLLYAFSRRGWHGKRIRIDGGDVPNTRSTISLIVGNQPRLGNQFLVLPGAQNNDGLLDVFEIHDLGSLVRAFETVARTIDGSHVGRHDVRMFRTKQLTVETDHPVPFFGDGQVGRRDTRFDISILRQSVKLLVPRSWKGEPDDY